MKTAVIAITKNGIDLAWKIGQSLEADVFVKNETFDKAIVNGQIVLMHPFAATFKDVMQKLFFEYEALICIMACGIVVRSIAPYLKNKQSDPAVVVVDELGRFAISLVSGHIGGANRLAGRVAAVIGGIPVITTATDINGVVAFDELAVMNNCVIENIDNLKYISSELVNGGKVCLLSDCELNGVLPANIVLYDSRQQCKAEPEYQSCSGPEQQYKTRAEQQYKSGPEQQCNAGAEQQCDVKTGHQYDAGPKHPYKAGVVLSNRSKTPAIAEKILYLRPKNLILGIGCKKGKSKKEIQDAVADFMAKSGKSLLSVRCIASIDLKSREKGINEFSEETGIPFKTFSVNEIKKIENQFSASEFVRKAAGVGNVAEACAVLAGAGAKLIRPKTVYNGITLALAEEEKIFTI